MSFSRRLQRILNKRRKPKWNALIQACPSSSGIRFKRKGAQNESGRIVTRTKKKPLMVEDRSSRLFPLSPQRLLHPLSLNRMMWGGDGGWQSAPVIVTCHFNSSFCFCRKSPDSGRMRLV
ncbi:hypothetical protein CEXT_802221 [Caerostris extrusa]|uniref:Uncharacterized protein n=1 Tax=Caerostris extrusa TaxID=172846 RepID=A0AAV4NU78_CAEEX|nr:hypothetical protein CEXT_802221 [Caerostris extrusa]